MELALEPSDLAALDGAQKDAVLKSLFIALIADGAPSAEELAQFEQTISALPWGKDRAQLQAVTGATIKQLAGANDDAKRAILRELAAAIPDAALREKVVLDMASIVAADRVATMVERSTIQLFVEMFGLDPKATLDKIKARIPASDVAAELGLQIDPADIAALDDSQKLAVIEALVVGVLADGQASAIELRVFDNIVGKLPWGMERPVLEATIKSVGQRIAGLATPTAKTDFIVGMARRLPTLQLREKVLCTVASIAAAQGGANQFEQSALSALVLAFGITSDRLEAIKRAVTGRSTASAPTTAN